MGRKILSRNMPRRFEDHRRVEARQWSKAYNDIIERYPPRDNLARELTAIAADFLEDYKELRRSAGRKNMSPVRKSAGLFLATLRVLQGGGNGKRGLESDLERYFMGRSPDGA